MEKKLFSENNNRKSQLNFVLFCFISISVFLQCSAQIDLSGKLFHPVTEDGWKLTLENFKPLTQITKKYPVIICPEIGNSGNIFKINEKDSLVYSLQANGYDVWILELRGQKSAGKPSLFFGKKKYTYSLDDHVKTDIATAIDFILDQTKSEKVNWVGHGYGGALGFIRSSSYDDPRIANIIGIGTQMNKFKPNKGYLAWKKSILFSIAPVVHFELFAKIKGNLGFSLLSKRKFEYLYYGEKENIDKNIYKKSLQSGFANISPKVFKQLKDFIEFGELKSLNKEINYTENLAKITVPTLMVYGKNDFMADEYTSRELLNSIHSKDKEVYLVSKSMGHSNEYGHMSLVIGRKSNSEVFKKINQWLDKRN